uniref:NADH-ubiquinone oxidoreductase chain 4 n=1 Tax=Brachymeria sp. ZJUH_2016006 TaxID=2491152 RepID=A0A3Q8U9W2_9HYME|nr:NADH dehydrogenase subunit 4 [Brachymeria sp. ZJUH_2016006]
MMKFFIYYFSMMFMMNFYSKKIIMMFYGNMIFISLIMMLLNYSFLNNMNMQYLNFGLDKIGMLMILMLLVIISLMLMINDLNKDIKFLTFLILLMLLSLIIVFSSVNYFIFYLFFEISMIPTFFLILGWGYQPERMNASLYMLFYTMFFSMPMLLFIYYFFKEFNSLNYLILLNSMMKMKLKFEFIYIYMMFSFFMKLPMFIFHLWLPKAHVEAPMIGSMFLAAVMLKLGGYGIFRTQMFMMNYSKKLNYMIMVLSLLGVLIISMFCLVQIDMKMIVAYSSVVHMGVMMIGLLSMSQIGMIGSLMIMLGHGYCSSALFMMINLFYKRSKSRMIFYNKGLILLSPSLMIMWFMFCMGNISMPTSLNLLGEMMMFMNFMWWEKSMILFFSFSVFFSTIYSIKLFSVVFHGKSNLIKFYLMNFKEYYLMYLHFIFLYFMFLMLNILF